MSHTIRQAIPSDAPALLAMNQVFNGSAVSLDWIEARLAAPASMERVLVADNDGAVVGFCCLVVSYSICYPAPRVEIAELFVDPKFRRRGIARQLVRKAIRISEEMAAGEMTVVANQRNDVARKFYESSGFEKAPHVRFRRKDPIKSAEPTSPSDVTQL